MGASEPTLLVWWGFLTSLAPVWLVGLERGGPGDLHHLVILPETNEIGSQHAQAG